MPLLVVEGAIGQPVVSMKNGRVRPVIQYPTIVKSCSNVEFSDGTWFSSFSSLEFQSAQHRLRFDLAHLAGPGRLIKGVSKQRKVASWWPLSLKLPRSRDDILPGRVMPYKTNLMYAIGARSGFAYLGVVDGHTVCRVDSLLFPDCNQRIE